MHQALSFRNGNMDCPPEYFFSRMTLTSVR